MRRTYERFLWEHLPVARLLRCDPPGGSNGQVSRAPEVREIDLAGAKCEFVVSPARARLSVRTLIRPDCTFSSWVRLPPPPRGGEYKLEVAAQGGEISTLTRIPVRGTSHDSFCDWRRVDCDLSRFGRQEVTLYLSADLDEGEAGWADPRILRRRSAQEYYVRARTRLAEGGVSALAQSVLAVARGRPAPVSIFRNYPNWVKKHRLNETRMAQLAKTAASFLYRPLISVLTPTFNTDPAMLRSCIQSVQKQIYDKWELCVCDDGSVLEAVRQTLAECAGGDNRIKVQFVAENHGIAEATNAALRMASGEFVGFLDHDDMLAPEALFENVQLLQAHPEADVIYSDEDKIEEGGTRSEPFFKPDWSPELLSSYMYTGHFSVYRRQLVEAVGGVRTEFAGSQDYDLILRVSEQSSRIFHIPSVLYHWRKAPTSTAADARVKSSTTAAGLRALEEHFQRTGRNMAVLPVDRPNRYRVRPAIEGNPLVSIVIPCKAASAMLEKCIRSIRSRTKYANYEIVVVENTAAGQASHERVSSLPDRLIRFDEPFNFSRMNNLAARECKGDYLLCLNDDTEVISPDWLGVMLGYAQLPEIGAVGAKLYYPDGSVQHAGIVLGIRGTAGHWLRRFPGDSRGYFDSLVATRNFSAVTAACALFRRDVFESVGEFDERLPIAFNDVDLCLRIRQAGYRIVWVPEAELYHHESATRQIELDPRNVKYTEYLRKRWGQELSSDPYYNCNLTIESEALALKL